MSLASTQQHQAHLRCSRRGACGPASRAPGAVAWRCGHPAAPRRQPLAVARVADVTEASFEQEVLKADKDFVLVDFWDTWCGPCKLVAPLMAWAEKEYGSKLKVVKVQHDGNPNLVAQFKVYGLPALIVFKNGEMIAGSKREGAISQKMLADYLAKHGVTSS